MNIALFLLGCLLLAADAAATEKWFNLASGPSVRQSLTRPVVARANEPVFTTAVTGPEQTGYVHYFVITKPDETRETQIGIELPDQRIAWSFPELGVAVSPFIESGRMPVNGELYEVQHLYGIRPFPDEESMLVLREALMRRVIPWVEDGTPYCDLKGPSGELCVSCLGFVLRILFPGRSPDYPALPRDFKRVGPDAYYTTEDLLLYLAGLHGLSTREARLKRIGALTLPQSLREELIRLVDSANPDERVGAADGGAPSDLSGKGRPGARPYSKIVRQRLRQHRKL